MIIKLPDGKKATFPDDMEEGKIRDFINENYPEYVKEIRPDIDVTKLSGTDVMSDGGINSSPMRKLNFMLDIAGLATKSEKLKPVHTAITAARAITNTDYSQLGSQALKSAGRQTTELTVGGTGFLVKSAGRLLHDDNFFKEEDFNKDYKFNVPYMIWKANQETSGSMIKMGEAIEKLSEKVQNSDLLKADEELFAGSFEENPNLHKVADLAMSGVSSLVGMYTISKVTNPAVGLYFMSGVDAKDVFEESLEAGNSKLKTVGLWGAATLGTAQLEKFGFEKVFNVKISSKGMKAIVDSSKKTSEKILEGMISEGAEEGLQTIWQNTIAKIGYDDTRDIFQNAIESAVGGDLGGGLVSSFNYGIQSFNKKSKQAGLNEQEQTSILNGVAQSIADNPDLVDVPFQENMKKTYDSFSKMIAEMEDSPEKQRLIATKEALDTGYQKYYDEFKSYMPEEQAKANANLLRSSALFFSDLEGISVDEWFKTKAPQIRRMSDLRSKAKEFIDSVTPTKLKLDENEIDLFEALKNPDLVKKYEEKDTRQSLTQFIKRNGGVKDVGGDLKAMDIGKQIIGVINNKGGNSLDDVALSAWENGYFPEMTERPTVNDLLDAIREESFGKKRYAGEKKQGIGDYVETLAQNLDMLGINYQNMTPREIEKAYNEALDKYNQSVSVDEMQEPVEDFGFMDNEYFQMANENAQLDAENPAYEGETINIDGKEKTVYNSNGEHIAKSEAALRNFYKWFGDSKVVDKQGRPKVMYHGTPNAIYDTLRAGTYFTDNKAYAEVYKSQGASSISYKKEALKPDVYAVYIKMEKPFDTRNKEARDDFYKYYYQQMGMGTDLQESGLPDWNDGIDLLEFITEYHHELGYDGILLDEGGVGGYGEDVKSRGISYVTTKENQVKSTSNRGTYSESENIYYQSAFAGSRVDYDEPSLEAIGSGEGAQAHGWGLYYALNRDVAEDYRKTFVEEQSELVIGDRSIEDWINSYDWNNETFDVASNVLYDIKARLEKQQDKDSYEARQEVLMVLGQYARDLSDDLHKGNDDEVYLNHIREDLDNISKLRDELATYSSREFSFKQQTGQVHEVDIPENPYLLDEQKSFDEQSDFVKEKLNELLDDLITPDVLKANPNYKEEVQKENGGEIYKSIAILASRKYNTRGINETKKKASEALYQYGIKGITYDGREDGRCFVIFNPKDVKVIQKFYQGEQNPLGAYANRIIYINDNANASTLPHELAHFWSDELKRSKSLRAKEILRQADIWENKEFDRKYKIEKQENGYVVTDKSGKTIYDRMGEGFRTEEQAKAYAKEELFARGFEKYIKEGKAPSKTLRVVFANFYNWLKKIYSDMLSLDIKLSKPMRELYSNILGSTNIDVFLDSDVDSFIEQREQAEEQKEKIVQNIIDKAPVDKSLTLPEKIRKAYEEFDFGESWKKAIIPLSTRAKRVAPTLRNKIRRFEFDLMETKQNYYRQTEPLMRKWNKFSKEDAIAFDLALKNGAVEIRDRILRKYNAVADFEKVKAVLEDIYYKANDAGLDVGYIEDYFPRKIIDKDGLMSYLHGAEEWSSYQQALQREDPHNRFTAEEQAEFLDKFLRGVVRADVAAYKYSSEKARKLDIIDNTLNQYYADSMQALISYIDGMNARISTVNFFGRNRENVDESIGEFVAYLLNNNKIKPSQVDEVKSILNAVFKRAGVRQKWIKGLRDMAYIYTMGGVNTAITQIDDIFVAAYKGGVLNTIQSAFSKDRVTKKDLGLDSIAAEFMNSSGTSKAVNWVFTHNGIELIDGFGKNSLLNGVLKKMEKMSDTELREYIEPIMEEETEQTIRDVRNGELSANVRFFLFNELSDMQPVSLSELPEIYNVGGNARIFYMLKSFMLKRIDTIRNECYDKIRSNNKAERVEGWQNLYKLVLLMMIGGATKDLLIDLMYNRVIDISDTVVNNLLGMIGISKYNIYQVREEGFGHTISIFVTPPLLQVADDLAGDVNKYLQGKRELKDFEVFKGLPIIGRFYYWLAGGGKTKMEKKKKRGA